MTFTVASEQAYTQNRNNDGVIGLGVFHRTKCNSDMGLWHGTRGYKGKAILIVQLVGESWF